VADLTIIHLFALCTTINKKIQKHHVLLPIIRA